MKKGQEGERGKQLGAEERFMAGYMGEEARVGCRYGRNERGLQEGKHKRAWTVESTKKLMNDQVATGGGRRG